ncbi:MAG TPA: tRNA epoxyqueuosine(34) reductase QueG [Chthoniobacterales bacterium]|jgi:epoxyqueuosine reductase
MQDGVKSGLVARAAEVGFDLCRVTTAEAAPHAADFQKWLAEGKHATMEWLARGAEKRANLELVLPGVRSIVVLATNYFQGGPLTQGRGKIARYAWGMDYHDLIEPRLAKLGEYLTSQGGRQRSYTDTGPVLERDFAARAGIGWHGKSTMILNSELGTWFFLSVILTTLELEPDMPAQSHCGSCTRCMVACPTNAIIAPRQLDARRCVSYLTIENKGSIPLEFRRAVGDRIYGCDDCLTACPWNRFAKVSQEITFQATPATGGVELRDYLTWNDDEFRQRFRGSPIKRIKRRGFLRNVCVVLGNIGTEDDLPVLRSVSHDPEPLIAEHAAWAIEEIEARLASRV